MHKNFERKSRVLQARAWKYFVGLGEFSVRLRAAVDELDGVELQQTLQCGRPWWLPEKSLI